MKEALLFWFRVELDAHGKVVSRHQVDAARGNNAGGIYYIKAVNGEAAESIAYKAYHRVKLAERRAGYLAAGRCRQCGRARDAESEADRAFRNCPKCRESGRVHDDRGKMKAQGLELPPVDKAAKFVERRNEEQRILLEDVHKHFMRMPMRLFGQWLLARIASLASTAPPRPIMTPDQIREAVRKGREAAQ